MSKETSSFYQKVYEVARMIPRGRVTSYGAIARYIGSGGSARTVGYAMNSCRTQFPAVPAHRVVNRLGMLSGKHHFSYPEQMEELLEAEGVKVSNDQVLLFDELYWEPMKELDVYPNLD